MIALARTAWALFVSALLWSFLASFIDGVGGDGQGVRAQTGGLTYFPWVLGGITVTRFLDVSLSTFAAQIRTEQSQGTLEAMLVTPARLWHVILASSSWSFLFAGIQAGLGLTLLGVDAQLAGPLEGMISVLLVIILTVLAFSGIGILSAAFVLYFKRGNPINFVITSSSMLFGNALVPVQSLPESISWISKLIPTFYATDAMRGALFLGRPLAELAPNLLALAAFAAVLLPTSLLGARYAVRKAKQEGSLIQY